MNWLLFIKAMEVRYRRSGGKYVICPMGGMNFEAARRVMSMKALLKVSGFCYTLDLKDVTCLDPGGVDVLYSIGTLIQLRERSFQLRNVAAIPLPAD